MADPGTQKFSDVIVAVHGIGEQIRSSTVRSVATRLARSTRMLSGAKAPLPVAPQPLGYFHSDPKKVTAVIGLHKALSAADPFAKIGFAEVYWADIPQNVVKEGATLEETKEWGRTVVARAEALWLDYCAHSTDAEKKADTLGGSLEPDFGLAAEVIDEIIETIFVLENLLFLARKTGLFSFDLRRVLEAYLGDVQLVTEFASYRKDIVLRFHRAMDDVYRSQIQDGKAPRIHIVAHSEGTVVSFLGLLQAMSGCHVVRSGPPENPTFDLVENRSAMPDWIRHVHGYMTIGSPIDKHLLLWPDIWTSLSPCAAAKSIEDQIKWRNYYDYGDPIGFELNAASQWVNENWHAFEFKAGLHDIGFARYLLPGKAHNDYWNDAAVFEHFIDSVPLLKHKINEPMDPAPPPPTNPVVYVLGPTLPYLLSALVLFGGVYLLCHAVVEFTSLARDPVTLYHLRNELHVEATHVSAYQLLRNTAGLTALLAGVTLFARLPRLATGKKWFWFGCLFFVTGGALYCLTTDKFRYANGTLFIRILHELQSQPWLTPAAGPHWRWLTPLGAATLGVLIVALLVALIGYLAKLRSESHQARSERWFLKRMRPLIFCGAAAIAVSVVVQLYPARLGARTVTGERENAIMRQDGLPPRTMRADCEKAVASPPFSSGQPTAVPSDRPLPDKVLCKRTLKHIAIIERAGFDWLEARQFFLPDELRRNLSRLDTVGVLFERPPVWPVVLAGLAFLYLWWLATLIFDLAFVWHRYVRQASANKRLVHWGERKLNSPSAGDSREPAPSPG